MSRKYEHDVFYNVSQLTVEQKINLLTDAKQMSFEWWVDILDCSKSWARQKIEMSFMDIMKKFDNNSHFVVIHRKGYINQKHYIEIGFRTMTTPDYFLWLHLKVADLQYLVNKYNLTRI